MSMTMGTSDLSRQLSQLRALHRAGYELIPLRGKVPVDAKWTTKDYSGFPPKIPAALRRGYNVGIRLRKTDLIIDVDPRNFTPGDDPLARLSEAAGADLSDAPTTITGGGGLHLFFMKPPHLRIVAKLPDYPGIDFKTFGGQVVAPGSLHPTTGRFYAFDSNKPDIDMTDDAPAGLLALLQRPVGFERTTTGDGVGILTPEQFAGLDRKSVV